MYQDGARKLQDAELAELERLRQRLKEEADKPTPRATPAANRTSQEPETYKVQGLDSKPQAVEPPAPSAPKTGAGGQGLIDQFVPKGAQAAIGEFAPQAAASIGRLAAAAGPAAAVMLAVEVGTRAVTSTLGKMERAVDATGKGLAQLASNDNAGAAATAFQAVTGAMDEAGPILKVFSAEVKLAVAPVRAMGAVSAAFVERGRAVLSRFNSDIGAANARASTRSTLADNKEAQALGQQLARLTDNQSEIETNIRDLVLPIKEVLVSLLAEVSEVGKEGTALLKEFAPVIRFFVQVLAVVPMTELKLFGLVLKGLNEWLDWIPGFRRSKDGIDPGKLNNIFKQFLDSASQIPPPPAGGRFAQDPQPARGPIFPGAGL